MSSNSARPALHLPTRYLEIVRNILRRDLPHAEVWAYGSRVNGDHYDASDLDLVVRQPDDLTRRQPDLDEVTAAFSDSDLPILVQIVDWAHIPAAFREEIEAGYVVLQSADGCPVAPTDDKPRPGSSATKAARRNAKAARCKDAKDSNEILCDSAPLSLRVNSGWLSNGPCQLAPTSTTSRARETQISYVSPIPNQSLKPGTMPNEVLFDIMPIDWVWLPLGEVCRRGGGNIQTGPFGSQLHASAYVSVGVPSIMPQNITGDRVDPKEISRITPADAERLSRYLVEAGDIVYSGRGDVERRALITANEAGWLCGTGCLRVRFGKAIVDPRYASYFLSHPASREWVVRHAVGATMPNLNTSILGALPFLLPPFDAQRAIAAILGALDDKIEQNRRTARALEGVARAIFRAWFVDFEPVKAKAAGSTAFSSMPQPVFDALPSRFVDSEIGPVPEGWEVFQHRVAELEAHGALSVGDGYRAKRSELADSGFPFIRAGNVNGTVNTEGAELLCAESAAKAGPKRSRVWDTVFTSKGTVGRIGLITPWTGDVVYAPQV